MKASEIINPWMELFGDGQTNPPQFVGHPYLCGWKLGKPNPTTNQNQAFS